MVGGDRADQTLALGLPRPWFDDLYYRILTVGWWRFLLTAAALYVAMNVLFALLYLLGPDGVANAAPGSFADAFFFSVETLATVGYGQMYPASLYANLIMTVETFFGLAFVALFTGLSFARFSRPTARIMFSEVAVIGLHNGKPTFSLRLANQRGNQILQAEVSLIFVRDEETAEGVVMRRFYDLKLSRHRTPVFALTFSVLHQIDATSPLYGATAASLEAQHAEFVVTATGLDETMAQPVHARASYLPEEIRWNHRFVDMIGWTEDGRRAVDYRRFHETAAVH
jgi:inward rectifier potassium channel